MMIIIHNRIAKRHTINCTEVFNLWCLFSCLLFVYCKRGLSCLAITYDIDKSAPQVSWTVVTMAIHIQQQEGDTTTAATDDKSCTFCLHEEDALIIRLKTVLCFWHDHSVYIFFYILFVSVCLCVCVCLSSRLWRDGWTLHSIFCS